MTPVPVRSAAPSAVVGLVIALCALLLLKWLAVVALVVMSVVYLVRWVWQRQRAPQPAQGHADEPDVVAPSIARPAGPSVGAAFPRRRADTTRPSADDCSWCGLSGGHWAPDGARLRPRHAHAER